jgi:hypothetical protein
VDSQIIFFLLPSSTCSQIWLFLLWAIAKKLPKKEEKRTLPAALPNTIPLK